MRACSVRRAAAPRWARALARATAAALLLVPLPARAEVPPSLRLSEALALARTRVLAVKVARESERSAEAGVRAARASYAPSFYASVSGTGSSTRSTVPAPVGFFDVTVNAVAGQGQALVSWTLWNFGQTASAVRAAKEGQASAAASREQALLDAQRDAAAAYLSVFYAEQLRRVADESVEHARQHVLLAQGLVARGVMPPVEELRASAAVDAAQVASVTAEEGIINARATLSVLLALDPRASFSVEAPPALSVAMTGETAIVAAERARPELTIARANEAMRDAMLDASRAAYRPTLALSGSGSFGLTARDSESVTRKSFGVVGGLTLSMPLFDAALGPRHDDAQNDLASATFARSQAQVAVRTEALQSALLVDRTTHQAALAERAAESAGLVLAVARARYEKGLAAPLELLAAEVDDATARSARVQAAQAHGMAVIRLLAATGRIAELGGT